MRERVRLLEEVETAARRLCKVLEGATMPKAAEEPLARLKDALLEAEIPRP
jgi:hypothetical protein